MFDADASEKLSGAKEIAARLKFDFCLGNLDLSETRVALLLVLGIDGVIERDFGKSGKFKFDANIELYLPLMPLS